MSDRLEFLSTIPIVCMGYLEKSMKIQFYLEKNESQGENEILKIEVIWIHK